MAISGTKEWAVHNFNIAQGCSHNCRYCYARANAIRFGRIKKPDEWTAEQINEKNRHKKWRKRDGRIMFPTTHDITPNLLRACHDAPRATGANASRWRQATRLDRPGKIASASACESGQSSGGSNCAS